MELIKERDIALKFVFSCDLYSETHYVAKMRRRVTNQLSREKAKGLDYINDKLSRKKGFHFRGEKKIPLAQDKGSEILLQKLEIYPTGGQTLVKLPVTTATVNEEFM